MIETVIAIVVVVVPILITIIFFRYVTPPSSLNKTTKMKDSIISQKMIKEGLWTIELTDGTIIQCTNNGDFKILNQNKDE